MIVDLWGGGEQKFVNKWRQAEGVGLLLKRVSGEWLLQMLTEWNFRATKSTSVLIQLKLQSSAH
jgi:hypothetical protein